MASQPPQPQYVPPAAPPKVPPPVQQPQGSPSQYAQNPGTGGSPGTPSFMALAAPQPANTTQRSLLGT